MMMKKQGKIDAAIDFLEEQGYYLGNLWHIDDVMKRYKCTKEEAMDILDDAVGGEFVMEMINCRIVDFCENEGFEPIEEDEE